jgi:hypothetical protein
LQFSPPKTQTARTGEVCAAVLALYIQNIKLEGVLCQNQNIYISFRISGLQANPKAGGLDKKKSNVFELAVCKLWRSLSLLALVLINRTAQAGYFTMVDW